MIGIDQAKQRSDGVGNKTKQKTVQVPIFYRDGDFVLCGFNLSLEACSRSVFLIPVLLAFQAVHQGR